MRLNSAQTQNRQAASIAEPPMNGNRKAAELLKQRIRAGRCPFYQHLKVTCLCVTQSLEPGAAEGGFENDQELSLNNRWGEGGLEGNCLHLLHNGRLEIIHNIRSRGRGRGWIVLCFPGLFLCFNDCNLSDARICAVAVCWNSAWASKLATSLQLPEIIWHLEASHGLDISAFLYLAENGEQATTKRSSDEMNKDEAGNEIKRQRLNSGDKSPKALPLHSQSVEQSQDAHPLSQANPTAAELPGAGASTPLTGKSEAASAGEDCGAPKTSEDVAAFWSSLEAAGGGQAASEAVSPTHPRSLFLLLCFHYFVLPSLTSPSLSMARSHPLSCFLTSLY